MQRRMRIALAVTAAAGAALFGAGTAFADDLGGLLGAGPDSSQAAPADSQEAPADSHDAPDASSSEGSQDQDSTDASSGSEDDSSSSSSSSDE